MDPKGGIILIGSIDKGFSNTFTSTIPQLLAIDGLDHSSIDFFAFANNFLENGVASSVDANANVRFSSVYTFINETPKPLLKLFNLHEIYLQMKKMYGVEVADEMLRAQLNGAIYIHDLHHAAIMPYCYAFSLRHIAENGLDFIPGIKSLPPKHLFSFVQQVIQFVMFASNQQSGAVGLPDFFVWLNYFYMKDLQSGYIPQNLAKTYLEQAFQMFTYSVNQPIRGTQSPYTNLTFMDRNYIKKIFEKENYPDGSPIIEQLENIISIQKAYWEWIAEEREKQMFTFPVLTASLLYKDGNFVDEDSARFINKVNLKWQDTNWYISDSIDAIASCCRLTSSMSSLSFSNKKAMVNSIGGSDLNIGSFKVVTINLPRIALESKFFNLNFFEVLEKRVRLVHQTLAAIRALLQKRIKQKLLPLYDVHLVSLNRQFGTVGITGVFEAMDILGFTVIDQAGARYSSNGLDFINSILDFINGMNKKASFNYGFAFNVEQVPAEKAAVTLAQKDSLLFKTDYKVYSNQWLPLSFDADLLDRIVYSGMFDKKVNGGAILHINLGSPFRSEIEAWEYVNLVAKHGVVYFAFNQKISVCKHNHAFMGDNCPVCGEPKADEFLRIVGYLVPVSAFNKERRVYELPNRKFYFEKEVFEDAI